MNITITRTTSFARLDRIERYAVRAHQRLIHRAFAELNAYRIRIGQETIQPRRLQFTNVADALRWLSEHGDLILSAARGGGLGLRLARIVRRAEALDAALETVSEEYGTRDGRSAADCAAWSDRQYAIACWEDRHGERWQGEW
jgi:hypothetical protein